MRNYDALVDAPVVWLDIKGHRGDCPVQYPLEASYLITHGLSSVAKEGQECMRYRKNKFEEIKKTAHVSCLKNGLLDDVAHLSKLEKKFISPNKQVVGFWQRGIWPALAKSFGKVWFPIWRGEYEAKHIKTFLAGAPENLDCRLVEMRDVSGFLVDVLGMDHPLRSDWRSLASVHWYFNRTRQLAGVLPAPSRFGAQA